MICNLNIPTVWLNLSDALHEGLKTLEGSLSNDISKDLMSEYQLRFREAQVKKYTKQLIKSLTA